jgi:membrane-associated phospholipid phosphatase
MASIGFGFLVQRNHLLLHLDSQLYILIVQAPHPQWLTWLISPFNYNIIPFLPGNSPNFYYVFIAGAALYIYRYDRANFLPYLLCTLIGNILVHLISYADSYFVFRERPFLLLHSIIDARGYNAWHALSSYPSGHTRDTTLYTTIMVYFLPKLRWPVIALIAFIAFSRVYIGAHYPFDALAGIGIGLATSMISYSIITTHAPNRTTTT